MQWMEPICEQACRYFFVICWTYLSLSFSVTILLCSCVSQNQPKQRDEQQQQQQKAAKVTFFCKCITIATDIFYRFKSWFQCNKKMSKKISHHLSHKTIASAKLCDFSDFIYVDFIVMYQCITQRMTFNDRRNKFHLLAHIFLY